MYEPFNVLIRSQTTNGPYDNWLLQTFYAGTEYDYHILKLQPVESSQSSGSEYYLTNGSLIAGIVDPKGSIVIGQGFYGGCSYGAAELLDNSGAPNGSVAMNEKTSLLVFTNTEEWDKGNGTLVSCAGDNHFNFCYSKEDGSGPFLQMGQLGGKNCSKVFLEVQSW